MRLENPWSQRKSEFDRPAHFGEVARETGSPRPRGRRSNAEVVQNDPADTYLVVRLLPDGPKVRLPKDVVVKAPPEGD